VVFYLCGSDTIFAIPTDTYINKILYRYDRLVFPLRWCSYWTFRLWNWEILCYTSK